MICQSFPDRSQVCMIRVARVAPSPFLSTHRNVSQ